MFAHRLAIALGYIDVAAMLSQITHGELMQWMAYFEVEPWGEARADTRSAIIAASAYNMRRARGQPARQVADFLAHRPSRADATPAHISALKASLMARGNRAGTDKPDG